MQKKVANNGAKRKIHTPCVCVPCTWAGYITYEKEREEGEAARARTGGGSRMEREREPPPLHPDVWSCVASSSPGDNKKSQVYQQPRWFFTGYRLGCWTTHFLGEDALIFARSIADTLCLFTLRSAPGEDAPLLLGGGWIRDKQTSIDRENVLTTYLRRRRRTASAMPSRCCSSCCCRLLHGKKSRRSHVSTRGSDRTCDTRTSKPKTHNHFVSLM